MKRGLHKYYMRAKRTCNSEEICNLQKANESKITLIFCILEYAEAAGLTENQKTTESAVQTWLRRASDRRMTEEQRVEKTF